MPAILNGSLANCDNAAGHFSHPHLLSDHPHTCVVPPQIFRTGYVAGLFCFATLTRAICQIPPDIVWVLISKLVFPACPRLGCSFGIGVYLLLPVTVPDLPVSAPMAQAAIVCFLTAITGTRILACHSCLLQSKRAGYLRFPECGTSGSQILPVPYPLTSAHIAC